MASLVAMSWGVKANLATFELNFPATLCFAVVAAEIFNLVGAKTWPLVVHAYSS
jgi:hypothetical protein